MKTAIGIILTIVMLACDTQESEIYIDGGSLNVFINGSDLTTVNKSSNQGGIIYTPAYINGVNIKVRNLDYETDDLYGKSEIIQTFNFSETKDIVLENLIYGRNEISAVSFTDNIPHNGYYSKIKDAASYIYDKYNADASTLADIADNYDIALRKPSGCDHPVYAQYRSEKNIIKHIRYDSYLDEVLINMVTDNHRLSVITENPKDSKYKLKIQVSSEGKIVKESEHYIMPGNIDAVVINNEKATGNRVYSFNIIAYTKNSSVKVDNYSKSIEIKGGNNITRYYFFGDSELKEGKARIKEMNWKYIRDINSGEIIK